MTHRDFSLLVGEIVISHRDMTSERRIYRRLATTYPEPTHLASEVARTAQCFLDKQPEAAYLEPWEYTAFVAGQVVTLKQRVPREYY